MNNFDRDAGCLGLTPEGFEELLAWKVLPPGSSMPCLAPLGEVEAVANAIRLTLLKGAHRAWLSRCKKMDAWTKAIMSSSRKALFVSATAQRNRAHREKRERLASEKWRKNNDAKAPPHAGKRERRYPDRIRRQVVRPDFTSDGPSLEEEIEWTWKQSSVKRFFSKMSVPRL
jgi:hypothetical protein